MDEVIGAVIVVLVIAACFAWGRSSGPRGGGGGHRHRSCSCRR